MGRNYGGLFVVVAVVVVVVFPHYTLFSHKVYSEERISMINDQ